MREGYRVGDWTAARPLAGGGPGKAWLARHVESHELGVVKLLATSDPGLADRLFHALERLRSWSHPALAVVLDHDLHEGQPYVVMSYMPGESLEARLRAQQPMQVERALQVFSDLAFGLASAHAEGVPHGQVQARRIVLRPDGWGALVGPRLLPLPPGGAAASYLPPEAFEGAPAPTPPADVYALGQALYEALRGRAVFRGVSSGGTAPGTRHARIAQEKLASDSLDPGPAFSDPLRRWVKRATHPDPLRRPHARELAEGLATMLSRELRYTLARWSRGEPESEGHWTDVTTVPRAPSPMHRRRRLGLAIAVGAALMGALLLALGMCAGLVWLVVGG